MPTWVDKLHRVPERVHRTVIAKHIPRIRHNRIGAHEQPDLRVVGAVVRDGSNCNTRIDCPSPRLGTKKLITGVTYGYTCDEFFLAEIELLPNRKSSESIYAATLSKVVMSIE